MQALEITRVSTNAQWRFHRLPGNIEEKARCRSISVSAFNVRGECPARHEVEEMSSGCERSRILCGAERVASRRELELHMVQKCGKNWKGSPCHANALTERALGGGSRSRDFTARVASDRDFGSRNCAPARDVDLQR